MVRICSHCIIEKIMGIIRRVKPSNCSDKIEIVTNDDVCKYSVEHNGMNLKERIAKLIKENERYFICEVGRTTLDTVIHDSFRDLERTKRLGYSHSIAVDIFEKYGIFLYATDLSSYVYAPRAVKYELHVLINEYGLERVAEEIAVCLKDNYSNRFGIDIVCTP